jgi:hypothetical protein
MKPCPYCGYSNLDTATDCRKCQNSLVAPTGTIYSSKKHLVSSITAHDIRRKALAFIVIALLIKVYWGGYGPWPVVDNPTLESLRTWLEPLFLYGGFIAYITGWILNFV